jgi:phosphatidylglycerophosphatase B
MSDTTPVSAPRVALTIAALVTLGVLPALLVGWPDLDGTLAKVAWVMAESGSRTGLPVLLVAALVVLGTRPGGRPMLEVPIVTFVLAIVLGGGVVLNEFVIKPAFAIPRPNIVHLSEAGALDATPEFFYAMGDRTARSKALAPALDHPDAPALAPEVRDHWLAETGWSFPSGHAMVSTGVAVSLAILALAWVGGWRRRVLFIFVLWAIGVCWSRVLLGVHTPVDLVAGVGAGATLGAVAGTLCRRCVRPIDAADS